MIATLLLAAVVISLSLLNLVAYTVLPLVTGLATKEISSPRLKALVLVVLALLVTLATQAINDKGLVTNASATQFIIGLVVAIAIYFGLWKPTGVSDSLNEATANFGIGQRDPFA